MKKIERLLYEELAQVKGGEGYPLQYLRYECICEVKDEKDKKPKPRRPGVPIYE
jgi:hypothetical protein